MVNKKDRKHSGRKTVAYDDYHETYYSDWNNYRDGLRCPKDRTKISDENAWANEYFEKPRYNLKNKKLLNRRLCQRGKINLKI